MLCGARQWHNRTLFKLILLRLIMFDSNQCRIAIVEDDLYLQQSMQECLHACGYNVWAAASAEEFYRRIQVEPVDLVILYI